MATSHLSDGEVILHHAFYNEDCLEAACEAYGKVATVSIEPAEGYSTIAVTPAIGAPDSATLRREFLNYVLDLSIKKHLAS